jgi:ABC-2 type transport system permease protein
LNIKNSKTIIFLGAGMDNIINVAKKEFSDLWGSWLVVFIFAVFMVLTAFTDYQFYGILSNHHYIEGDIIKNFLCGVMIVLTSYGSLVAVVVGFASIASERQNNALNTLLVKPLYRDTIVNGKLLGSLVFLLCMFGLAVLVYTAGLFIVCGSIFAPLFVEYFTGLPFAIGISLVYTMIVFSVSMLYSILFRKQAFALALGVLSIFISQTISTYTVTRGLSTLTGYNAVVITGWSPYGILDNIIFTLYRSHPGLVADTSMVWSDTAKLLLYMVVIVVICYMVFLRRDVS